MFGSEQTSAPKATAPKPAEDDGQTFNSLMFGSEQTSAPRPAPPADAGEQTFNSLMFGSEQTSLGNPPAPSAADADPDATAALPPIGGTKARPEDIKAAANVGAAKGGMFERQFQAGKAAMDAGDYARAVQCLSVAASLRPNDKETRELLAEARRLRGA
jgi:hypothetical protein